MTNDHFEMTRRDQVAEGARMARSEGFDRVGAQRRSTLKRPGAKPAPAGHEAFLKALETSGAEIEIEKMSGEKVRGTVKHSDKFTITLRYVDGSKLDTQVINRVIFKHDISEFRALTAKPTTEGAAE